MTPEEYKVMVRACTDACTGKTKALLKLNLVRDIVGSKKGFYKQMP